MLIAKIYINQELIDEIHVQNVGKVKNKYQKDLCVYKILEPAPGGSVAHRQRDGYKALLIRVLELLEVKS